MNIKNELANVKRTRTPVKQLDGLEFVWLHTDGTISEDRRDEDCLRARWDGVGYALCLPQMVMLIDRYDQWAALAYNTVSQKVMIVAEPNEKEQLEAEIATLAEHYDAAEEPHRDNYARELIARHGHLTGRFIA